MLDELPPDAAERGTRQVARRLAASDPEKSRTWAESLPPGPVREAAWSGLGSGRGEPLDLAPGRDRDAMLSGLATAQVLRTPAKALKHALSIDDPALRRRTFDDAMWRLSRGTVDYGATWISPAPEAKVREAHEWLRSANVPDEWKRRWLQ